MSDETRQDEQKESEEFSKFQKLARALFRVDKRDVPKHEPVKRERPSCARPDDQRDS